MFRARWWRRLVRTGDADATQPREAILTVMFTDITGFTSISEQLPATASAAILNHHFSLLCDAIGAEGGTVDKFLGDGAMAFFGAPDRLKGHGAAAVRAAVAIREALKADNRTALENGRPPLSVRIGIHTGPVIVGNIGAADRVNYTIVGDTVNVSQRLQELGKLLSPDAETAIVISGETAGRVDDSIPLESFGTAPAAWARRADRRVPGRGIRRDGPCWPAGVAQGCRRDVVPFPRRPLVVSDRPSRAETAFTPKVCPWCRCAPARVAPKSLAGVSGRQVRAEFVLPAWGHTGDRRRQRSQHAFGFAAKPNSTLRTAIRFGHVSRKCKLGNLMVGLVLLLTMFFVENLEHTFPARAAAEIPLFNCLLRL